ncbi:MAG: hypothetical protein IMW89_00145 [Ktedonobacteraceae bacterium]|nr:hypothetical protein [Ktedonobacteraceae bacterium]
MANNLMSRLTTQAFTCPCGETFTEQIYEYVNAAREPRLRYAVLAGLLNVAICPACGRKAALSRPFLYSDPDHRLLAYVHPRSDAPEEARQLIAEKLRSVYLRVANVREIEDDDASGSSDGGRVTEIAASEVREMPPLKVVFGLDQLHVVLNAVLDPEERLGKLALSTQSRDPAARGQFLTIARKLAQEMECVFEVEDLPDEYTVWLYGARRTIGSLMRSLAI